MTFVLVGGWYCIILLALGILLPSLWSVLTKRGLYVGPNDVLRSCAIVLLCSWFVPSTILGSYQAVKAQEAGRGLDDFLAAAEWIRNNTRPDLIIMTPVWFTKAEAATERTVLTDWIQPGLSMYGVRYANTDYEQIKTIYGVDIKDSRIISRVLKEVGLHTILAEKYKSYDADDVKRIDLYPS